MAYTKLQQAFTDAEIDFITEYRLFAEEVGLGKGVRERLKEAGWRDFRYDFCLPDFKLMIEIQGSGFSHSHRDNQHRDMKKVRDGLKLGYITVPFPANLAKTRPDIIVEEILEITQRP